MPTLQGRMDRELGGWRTRPPAPRRKSFEEVSLNFSAIPAEAFPRKYVSAWLDGGAAKAENFYADNRALHHFGRNPLAGDSPGKDAMDEYIQMHLAVAGSAETLKVHQLYRNDSGGGAIIQARFSKQGKTPLKTRRATVFQIGADRSGSKDSRRLGSR